MNAANVDRSSHLVLLIALPVLVTLWAGVFALVVGLCVIAGRSDRELTGAAVVAADAAAAPARSAERHALQPITSLG